MNKQGCYFLFSESSQKSPHPKDMCFSSKSETVAHVLIIDFCALYRKIFDALRAPRNMQNRSACPNYKFKRMSLGGGVYCSGYVVCGRSLKALPRSICESFLFDLIRHYRGVTERFLFDLTRYREAFVKDFFLI